MLFINSFPSGAEGGSGVPSGGTTNQVLTKNSSSDGDVIWKTPADTSKFYATDDGAFTAIADNDSIPVYDTSSSTKMRSSWSNIKSLLKTDFDTLYQAPITAGANLSFNGNTLNASYPLMVNEFNRSDLYSTTEKVVGCWTDGRPIYQKTVELGAGPAANAKKTYTLNVSNVLSYVYCNIWSTWGNATYGDVPNLNAHCWIDDTGNLTIQSMNSQNLTTTYNFCVLRYTKTTDAANSFNYASENDYSTTEKIVGTWIDGKPLYQKTIVDTIPNASTDGTDVTKYISVGSSVELFTSLQAFRKTSANTTIPLPTYEGNTLRLTVRGRPDSSNANKNTIAIINSITTFNGNPIYITVQYTKTID